MNELTDLVAAAPQAGMAGATVYLLLSVRRIEARLETLANHCGAPTGKKCRFKVGTLLALAVALIFLSGCAVVSNSVKTTEADGTQRETNSRVFTFWDSTQTLDKLRLSNGKTHSIGAEGITETSASTNALALVERLTDLVKALPK